MPPDKADKATVHQINKQQAQSGRTGDLSVAEDAVLDRLLERKGESLPDALARKERERRKKEKLEKERDRLAALEQKKAMELRDLQLSIDTITDQLVLADGLSGVAKRDVTNKLSKFYLLTARFVEENDMPIPPRAAIRALVELAMTPYVTRSEPSLRQRILDGRGEK
jgi:hypothetical protein